MGRTQQKFINIKDSPIYISVEPWPHCFELEPADELTLIWDAPASGDAVQVEFANDRELVVYPNSETGEIVILFNDKPSEGKSWNFKHA